MKYRILEKDKRFYPQTSVFSFLGWTVWAFACWLDSDGNPTGDIAFFDTIEGARGSMREAWENETRDSTERVYEWKPGN